MPDEQVGGKCEVFDGARFLALDGDQRIALPDYRLTQEPPRDDMWAVVVTRQG